MTNLPAPVPAPSVTLKEIRMNSARFPRISAYTKDDAVRYLSDLIINALLYKGMEPGEYKVTFTAQALYNEIMEDNDGLGLPSLSFEEVRRVFRKCVLGQGRELFGVNVASLYAALCDYAKGEGHLAQLEANTAVKLARKAMEKETGAAVMMDVYAARMIRNKNQ